MSLDKVERFIKGEQERGLASAVMSTLMVMARVAHRGRVSPGGNGRI